MKRRFFISLVWLGFHFAASLHAAPVRVTEWNLEPANPSAKSQPELIQQAAAGLKQLNPDVIILQHVADWQSCDDLAKALQPETYHVAICSAFPNAGNQQVAILSKAKWYIAWSQPWQNDTGAPGGFAFAAIRLDGKNVGFISAQLSDGVTPMNAAQQHAREESAAQLARQVTTLQSWTKNRPETFIVAGDFNTSQDAASEKTLSRLEQAGFTNVLAGLPLKDRVTFPANGQHADATVDYIFVSGAPQFARPSITTANLAGHSAVTCAIEIGTPSPAAPEPPATPKIASVPVPAPAATSAPQKTEATPPIATITPPPAPRMSAWLIAGISAAIVLILFALRRMTRRTSASQELLVLPRNKPALGPVTPSMQMEQVLIAPSQDNSTVVHIKLAGGTQTQSQTWQSRPETSTRQDAVRAGVIAEMTHWLKQKLVRRLVSDRAELLAAHQAATLKVMAVDERLAKVEQQIQQRNREYELRIGELEKELAGTLEENRELIRAKIAQVRAEMERERARAKAYDQEHPSN